MRAPEIFIPRTAHKTERIRKGRSGIHSCYGMYIDPATIRSQVFFVQHQSYRGLSGSTGLT